jgi:hypothetical protein
MTIQPTAAAPAPTENWHAIEYAALRAEILSLAEAERSAVRFFIPAAAIVYTVPYALLPSLSVRPPAQQAFAWAFAAVFSGMLTLGLLQSLLWSADGARRIGAYIRHVIEPQTHDQLQWEAICFHLRQGSAPWPGEALTIGTSAVIANMAAAGAAARIFLPGAGQFWPLSAATLFAILSIPSLWRIAQSGKARRRYSAGVVTYLESRDGSGRHACSHCGSKA